MTEVPGYTFVLDDPRGSSDEEIAEGVALSNELREEFYPEEPPSELATAIAATRATPARYGLWRVRVRDAGGLLVSGTSAYRDWEHDTNPDVGGLGCHVRAGHRRRGNRQKAYVGITGVVPEHRGHGFGRLLKATLTLRLLAEMPDVSCVVTGNADSNAHMLAINEAMGYRPHASSATWEVSRAQVEQLLAERGVEIPTAQATAAVEGQRSKQLASA